MEQKKGGLMENSPLYVKNQICEDFIKGNQNNFPFLVLNIEPDILPDMGKRVRGADEGLKNNVLDKKTGFDWQFRFSCCGSPT